MSAKELKEHGFKFFLTSCLVLSVPGRSYALFHVCSHLSKILLPYFLQALSFCVRNAGCDFVI